MERIRNFYDEVLKFVPMKSTELAYKLGWSQQNYSSKRAYNNPKLIDILKVAEAAELTPAQLGFLLYKTIKEQVYERRKRGERVRVSKRSANPELGL